MALPPLDDPRLDLLVGIYAEAGQRLRRLLDNLLIEDGPRKFLVYQQILRQLEKLRSSTDAWSDRYVTEFVREAQRGAIPSLEAIGAITPQLGATVPTRAVRALSRALTGDLGKAISSVQALAHRIFRPLALEREFPALALQARREVAVGLAGAEATQPIRKRIAEMLREKFSDGIVTVVAKNGRRLAFPLDFYAGMVASATKAQAHTFATLEQAKEADHDLVRVTPNPSTIGDWCDAYRGRVYSISGGHPTFPPLSSLPNGGPPFHPWCRHGLGIYVPDLNTAIENKERANTDPRFLMQPNESVNKIAREWRAAQKAGTTPKAIKFA
jgi:hypothetical protein